MISQQPLFTDQQMPSPESADDHAPAPVWLQRTSLIVLVLFCFLIGIIVTVLPWFPNWVYNRWLLTHPSLHALLIQGWVRGIISGIGLLDIWIGVSEAIHYRDYRA
jgi:hypothetical protein